MFLWFQCWDFKHSYANSDTILSELQTARTFKASHTFNDLLFW